MHNNSDIPIRVPIRDNVSQTIEALNQFLRQIAASKNAEYVGIYGAEGLEIEQSRLEISFLGTGKEMNVEYLSEIISYVNNSKVRQPIYFIQNVSDSSYEHLVHIQAAGVKSAVVVPLGLPAIPKASLILIWIKEQQSFSPLELESIIFSGRFVGIFCKNIVIIKTCQEQAERLSALVELSTTIYSSLEYQVVLQKVIDLATSLVSASHATIYLLNAERNKLIPLLTNADALRNNIMEKDLVVGKGAEWQAAAQGEGVIVNGTSSYNSENPSVEQGSRMVVPLIFSGDTIGILCLHRDSGGLFTLEDLQFISIFARQAADVIENARMFKDLQDAYEKLSQTQEQMLETEKLRVLGEMACGVAHDFNNNLGAILGRAQLLQLKTSEPEVFKGLKEIEELALTGAETVKRTQEFARVRSKTVKECVMVNEVVRDAVEITKPLWQEQAQLNLVEIEVVIDLNAAQPVAGSSGELVDAFANIIQNSVEALQNGGKIAVKSYDQNGEVVVEITDDGVGMSPTVRERIFYPFFSTKGKGKAGLGMSVAYGILTRHQVAVEIDSEVSKGTCIRLIFPARPELMKRVPKKKPVEKIDNLKILLIDDDIALLDVVSELLSFLGHTTVTAGEGIQALAEFNKGGFDIVITDLGLPGMSGWDIAKAIKLKDHNMPVMIISGWGAQISESDICSAGVDLVLPKPFTHTQLKEAIGVLLQKQMAER